MRPDTVVVDDQDMEVATERSLAEIMAMGGEPIRVRPRATSAQMATIIGVTGSSNETALRY
eukprot:12558136-Heterocapsa_arctica.AAC.1